MATTAATPEVFVRKSSGLVRVMSPSSAFIYNVLTMGLIFPWTYLWAPGALPGGQIVWGILLAVVLEIPIALAYVWLSTALPAIGRRLRLPEPRARWRDRVHPGHLRLRDLDPAMGRAVRLAAQLPRLRGRSSWASERRSGTRCSSIGRAGSAGDGIVPVSIINAFVALLDPDQRVQELRPPPAGHVGIAILLAFGTMLVVLGTTAASGVEGQLNAFSTAIGGSATFYADAVDAAVAAGVSLNPPFSLLATLLIAPIAWTSLQWATYSSQQNGEIKDARIVPRPGDDHHRRARPDGPPARPARGGPRERDRSASCRSPAPATTASARRRFNGVYLWPNILAIAISGSTADRASHQLRVHHERPPDRP